MCSQATPPHHSTHRPTTAPYNPHLELLLKLVVDAVKDEALPPQAVNLHPQLLAVRERFIVLDTGLLPAALVPFDLFLECYRFVCGRIDATRELDYLELLLKLLIEELALNPSDCNLPLFQLDLQHIKATR